MSIETENEEYEREMTWLCELESNQRLSMQFKELDDILNQLRRVVGSYPRCYPREDVLHHVFELKLRLGWFHEGIKELHLYVGRMQPKPDKNQKPG